ncbi:cytosolic sulfotransferase 13-like [Rutidosis leptorrhynchoides]|uniref:cytosolic sulfotransferase 13-like n=1 Tax=Rutidosis leptorrhynchoides TaxID=125765 RepID=UPI003A995B49
MSSATPSQSSERCLESLKVANLSLILDRYMDTYNTFPKEKFYMNEDLYLYQGFWYRSGGLVLHGFISIGTVMAAQETFQANPYDIYLATLPKSGTTWLKALAFAIVNRTKYKTNSLSTHPLLISNPHDCLPFIEHEVLRTRPTYADLSDAHLFATHIPYPSLPKSIIDSGCRVVIYICRNPKGVLISWFHFINKLIEKSYGSLIIEEVFERFCKGMTPCGPYWDHVKSYYKASLEHPTRIMFLTYENMINDSENNVKRLAEFLGYPFTEEEKANGVLQEIVKLCSFENLSEVNKNGKTCGGVPKNAFFRQGKVGDWSNYLTDEMSNVIDQITLEKFNGFDITF